MIIRIEEKYVSSAVQEWFDCLKSDEDILEEDSKESSKLVEYRIEIKEDAEGGFTCIYVDKLNIAHQVALDKLEYALVKVIGSLLGYESTTLHGFTVKDSSGKKMKPAIPIFFRTTLGVRIPEKLEYLKGGYTDPPEMDEGMMIPFASTSPIIKSLLASVSLRFSSESTRVLLTLYNGSMFMMPDTADIIPMIRGMQSRESMGLFLKLLKGFPFKFVETFIRAYQQPSSPAINKELSNCFSEFQNNLTKPHIRCIYKIVSSAPVFFDARDKITERIEKFYIYNAKGFKRKRGQYLKCREELYIDRNPIGSLLRYFKDL
ncbi:hypothetical protein EHEL_021190 [Encephalitozoon hellem ATCC 50504]|uniref:Uncharacterized protein n=1 Tax=Encephalitozoon hellem TaxID=27973 RepID=A0A9Q9F8U7_ENCHE|nr:uncharacterized protein EHEL_021190 [Encephalitozoon hellem ATCC 50504]AFM97873.1 hypothetical protein EHEL_021190 [Encephalitozoon hellem ATCC 50504]UTX42651.1 hypothetical protein GPU96_02g03660 [Encephalitozoon hellem]|eukprot:XP_003886854.1 hypothetical protein EHEL_021190 [Encephalitozoon hellem ATCC 50504]